MAKSLGLIHTVNFTQGVTSSGDEITADFADELSGQLERMIRQGQSFKLVGIDMSINTQGTQGGGQVTGFIRYYAPTRGRVLAYRNAFAAMKNAMKLQGIDMGKNKFYDFRVKMLQSSTTTIQNQATLDGNNGLVLYDNSVPGSAHSIFDVYNKSVTPTGTNNAALFDSGFNTMDVQNSPTSFVLNQGATYSGNDNVAAIGWEYIPFTATWTPDTTDLAIQFQWRPDPALYLSVMTGQVQIVIDEFNADGGASGVNLAWAFHIAGWKSIMSDRKPRRSSSSKKKNGK